MEEESRKGKNGTTLRLILSNENKTRKEKTGILLCSFDKLEGTTLKRGSVRP